MAWLFRARRHFAIPILMAGFLAGCGGADPQDTPTAEMNKEAPASPEEPVTDGPFTVSQTVPEHYEPGKANAVSFTMAYGGSDPVTALAIQVKLPLGWQFGAIQGDTKPAVVPKEGATDTVTMVWIQPPAFPAEVAYTVEVPDWAEGTYALEATAIYRALGGELRSPVSRAESTHP